MSGGAVSLYAQACRYALQANLRDPSSWTGGLEGTILRLRQALNCCVCGRVVNGPMGPVKNVCNHYVCMKCCGQKTRFIQPSCGWCKDHSEFVINHQLSSLVFCFKRLCQYLATYLNHTHSPCPDQPINSAEWIIRDAVAHSLDLNLADESTSKVTQTCAESSISPSSKSRSDRNLKSRSDPNLESRSDPSMEVSAVLKRERRHSYKVGSEKLQKTRFNSSPTTNGEMASFHCSSSSRSATKKKKKVEEHQRSESPPTLTHVTKLNFDKDRSFDTTFDESFSPCNESMNEPKSFGYDNIILSEHDYNRNSADSVLPTVDHMGSLERSPNFVGGKQSKRGAISSSGFDAKRSTVVSPSRDRYQEQELRRKKCTTNEQLPDVLRNCEDTKKRSALKGKVMRTGCRCAMSTPNPGKLTCCGQRCPCYSTYKGCVDCRCRGCRNPRGDAPSSVTLGMLPSTGFTSAPTSPVTLSHSVSRVTLL